MIAEFGEWLHQVVGIKLTILYDPWDRGRFLWGVWTTVTLSVICIAASVVVGMLGAWFQTSRLAAVRWFVGAYVQFFRNTPPLIQLYFFYFGVDSVVSSATGQTGGIFHSYVWAALTLSFFAGAFNVEIFRAGLQSVPHSVAEAATSLGYTPWQTFTTVTFPMAFRTALPALNSNLVNLVKTTTVAYAIAVPETLYVANQIWTDEYNVTPMMNVVWAFYLGLVGLLVWIMHRWEAAMRLPGFGQATA